MKQVFYTPQIVFKGLVLSLVVAVGLMVLSTNVRAQADASTIVVIMATPAADSAELRKEYGAKVNPLAGKAGVEIIKGVTISDNLIGDSSYQSIFLLGFSSVEAAIEFFSSDPYTALIPLRDQSFDQYDVLMGK